MHEKTHGHRQNMQRFGKKCCNQRKDHQSQQAIYVTEVKIPEVCHADFYLAQYTLQGEIKNLSGLEQNRA